MSHRTFFNDGDDIPLRVNDNDDICRGQETYDNQPGNFESYKQMLESRDHFSEDQFLNGPVIDESGENDSAPRMPDEFYDNIEHFLKRPAPKFGGIDNGVMPSKGKEEKQSSLPRIPPTSLKQQAQPPLALPPKPNKVSKATSKIKEIINGRTNEVKQIDPSLLREAFAYSEKVMQEAMFEEAFESSHQNRPSSGDNDDHPRSAPPIPKKQQQKANKGQQQPKKSTSTQSLVKKLRGQTHNVYMGHSDAVKEKSFDTAHMPEEDSKRNAIDYDALVANFEQGIMLQRLRAELEESKQNISKTTEHMKKLAQNALKGR